MNIFQRFFGHLKTVHTHRKKVRKLCFKMGLYWQGIIHDLSKYKPVEFINGVKFFTGKASPHYGERRANGYSKAWLNHKGHNKHHAEYWADISLETGKTENIPMPTKYLAEMMCDRVAASQTYLKNKYNDKAPLEYYLSHKDENQFHEETRQKLEMYLTMLSEQGSDVMFRAVREAVKQEKNNDKARKD